VFNADPWRDGWTEEAAEERMSQFVSFPGFRGLAAYDGSTPVGLVLGWKERWVQGWVFHIKEMCVAEQRRGRGIGSRLLSELEQLFSAEGVKSAYLETGNVAPARGFYEKRGYELISLVSLKKKF
jgi:ribosomal protein S18 acetylase RimI-like enzyme